MTDSQSTTDDVLPYNQSDIVNSVGEVKLIVSLDEHTDEEWVTDDGRCNVCGYDRETYKSHTEVAAWSLTCRQCEQVIGGES